MSKSDANLILDYLPHMADGVRHDPKNKNKRRLTQAGTTIQTPSD